MIQWWCETRPYGVWLIARFQFRGRAYRHTKWFSTDHAEYLAHKPTLLVGVARRMRNELFDEAGVW